MSITILFKRKYYPENCVSLLLKKFDLLKSYLNLENLCKMLMLLFNISLTVSFMPGEE